jgi:DNA-binding FadR family transcriptional regulator
MDEGLIQVQALATRIACQQMTARHLKAVRDSVEQAFCLPARPQWDLKAAAHAEIFHLLADVADDPVVAAILSGGTGLMHDLMTAVGPAADGMIATSRRRLLAHLRAGDADEAALEMEKHLRDLYYMWRLTRCSSR